MVVKVEQNEEMKNNPFYLLGQLECIIENKHKVYKTKSAQIEAIKNKMNEFYLRRGMELIK